MEIRYSSFSSIEVCPNPKCFRDSTGSKADGTRQKIVDTRPLYVTGPVKRHCSSCGAQKVAVQFPKCVNCGKAIWPSEKYCECGLPRNEVLDWASKPEPESPITRLKNLIKRSLKQALRKIKILRQLVYNPSQLGRICFQSRQRP